MITLKDAKNTFDIDYHDDGTFVVKIDCMEDGKSKHYEFDGVEWDKKELTKSKDGRWTWYTTTFGKGHTWSMGDMEGQYDGTIFHMLRIDDESVKFWHNP